LILIGVTLGLGHDDGDKDTALVLALRVLVHILPLDVVIMAHVDEGADLVLWKHGGNHALSDWVCSQIGWAWLERTEKGRDNI